MFEYQFINCYLKNNGTWVNPHLRGKPNGIDFDNINYEPEYNPYYKSFLDNEDLEIQDLDQESGFDSDDLKPGDSFDFDSFN